MELDEVTDKWEEAAQSELIQAHIHPSGAQSVDNYEASGAFQALEVREVASLYLPSNTNPRVADFGCGDGRVAQHLVGHFSDLWGVDASPTMLQHFSERVPESKTLLSNGIDKNLKNLRADLMFSWAVFIHHGQQEGARLLQGLASGMVKGGILALQIPLYELPTEGGSWCSVTVWTPEQFRRAASVAGLSVVDSHVSPGAFTYENIGENHARLQVMRLN